MTRHPLILAGALLLPLTLCARQPGAASPESAPASAAGDRAGLPGYVRPAAPTSSPDRAWLAANRALRERGASGMGSMAMAGMAAPLPAPAPSSPADPQGAAPTGHGGR